jgi:hypothetical protein
MTQLYFMSWNTISHRIRETAIKVGPTNEPRRRGRPLEILE